MQPSQTFISRDLAIRFGSEAVQIIDSGQYTVPSGCIVNIADLVERSVKGTKSYPPDSPAIETAIGVHCMEIEVKNASTLSAAQRLPKKLGSPFGNYPDSLPVGAWILDGRRA